MTRRNLLAMAGAAPLSAKLSIAKIEAESDEVEAAYESVSRELRGGGQVKSRLHAMGRLHLVAATPEQIRKRAVRIFMIFHEKDSHRLAFTRSGRHRRDRFRTHFD